MDEDQITITNTLKGAELWTCRHLQLHLTDPPPDNCPICNEPYTTDGKHTAATIVKIPGCSGHVFGLECIEEWISSRNGRAVSCPLCRSMLLRSSRNSDSDSDSIDIDSEDSSDSDTESSSSSSDDSSDEEDGQDPNLR